MLKKKRYLLALVPAALLLGGSAWAYTASEDDAGMDPDLALVPPPEEIDPPSVLEDFCYMMATEFKPGGLDTSVQAAMLGTIALQPTEAAMYLYLLEGEPSNIAPTYAEVRKAVTEVSEGNAVSDPAAAMTAAARIDQYLANNCSKFDFSELEDSEAETSDLDDPQGS